MSLSHEAEAKIKAMVSGGVTLSNHVLNSDHFDEDSAYLSARNFGRGADGLGPCSFFAYGNEAAAIHRSAAHKLAAPPAFTGQEDGYNLTGKAFTRARNDHRDSVNVAAYRRDKDGLRGAIETQLNQDFDNGDAVSKEALIKAFLLQKKAALQSTARDGRIEVRGPIPTGFTGYIIPPGVPKRLESYDETDQMIVVLGSGGGNPHIVTVYPCR